jgi:hypothetical protein
MYHFPIPKTTNIENLKKMAQYVENLPQSVFDMSIFRHRDIFPRTHECKTVGCIIGHCTVLDPNTLPVDDFFSVDYPIINFYRWCFNFTGIHTHIDQDEFIFLFGADWYKIDNTPKGAAQRIRYFIEYGLPENWDEQMTGNAPLSYLETNKNQ